MFNKYFPKGCDCGGEVLLNEELFMYKCSSCGKFVFAHRKESDHNLKFEPFGYLADHKTNLLRQEVKTMFNNLWIKKIDGKAIINHIYPEYIVCLDEEDGHYGVSMPTKEPYLIRSLLTGEFLSLGTVAPIHNRTKSFLWLSIQLGLKMAQVSIDKLKYDDLLKARRILLEIKNKFNL